MIYASRFILFFSAKYYYDEAPYNKLLYCSMYHTFIWKLILENCFKTYVRMSISTNIIAFAHVYHVYYIPCMRIYKVVEGRNKSVKMNNYQTFYALQPRELIKCRKSYTNKRSAFSSETVQSSTILYQPTSSLLINSYTCSVKIKL